MKLLKRFTKQGVKAPSLNIAIRIALLSWSVSMATILIFVLVTVPQQKQTFLDNLESKANGLAAALHDVAAGAAINEDYAGVVSAAQTLLSGDPDLDFLIVMKNDGFSLVVEQHQWRSEELTEIYWHIMERKSQGKLEVVPTLNRRVYHFAQPFDYSGIEWGWIHVGLSLEGYQHSVAALYRNTIVIALICICFSMAFSLFYARYLVRPILNLRTVVQKIAGGDLSVRAHRLHSDELGSLADSVNTMTEALLRRNHILESVRFASQQFLQTPDWEDAIQAVLTQFGQNAETGRAILFKIDKENSGHIKAHKISEWLNPEIKSPPLTPIQGTIHLQGGFSDWTALLGNKNIMIRRLSCMNRDELRIFREQQTLSLIAIPIFVDDAWWGYLQLEDCSTERNWNEAEEDSLRAGADMLGATIARQRVQDQLIEAKATLEQRVEERTMELKNQIIAKEQALSDLASAQNTLVNMSRAAGMAEVATGVLHNVGNVLNSINVSCTLVIDQLRNSRIHNIARVAGLLSSTKDPGRFLTEDPKGKQIPGYLDSLAEALGKEHSAMFEETSSLAERIEHVKEIVAMQQNYGNVSGINETIPPQRLMEDALTLNAGALLRHRVTVQRDYQEVPTLVVDKHKVLQILLNLINNAKYACTGSNNKDKTITLRIHSNVPGTICLEIADNGMGILEENMTKIFQHGFTTRRSGHGFGLHSGAIAAKELGGALKAHSDGPGFGAIFTLELPVQEEA